MRRADPARDRETVRRALVAGGVVWILAMLALVALSAFAGGLGPAVLPLIAVMGLVFAGLAASAWLVLAALLDVRAGEVPGRRRVVWTAGLLVGTSLLPVVAAALAGVAGD